ncbi:hypothetical protein DPMN_166701 [Dreissena polymorpha]|uniref:Uncharacterized protein n=1 Tax=Dreissena polymorpha TaxID=45954 RepID=A0A9D4IUE3_DREPO|nr:hypothetical protein DPMN_166701 [Dreissena polymorpha]
MKHGIALKPVTKNAYITVIKKTHKRFKAKGSGLTVLQNKPFIAASADTVLQSKHFIAASADLETECECCGKGICEIKCPESVKKTCPHLLTI